MININHKKLFTFCFEKNTFQFSYFILNQFELKFFITALFKSIGYFINNTNVNTNFYNTCIYVEIYKTSNLIFFFNNPFFILALKNTFTNLKYINSSIKIFIYVLENLKENNSNKIINNDIVNIINLTKEAKIAPLVASVIAKSLIKNINHQRTIDIIIKIFSKTFSIKNSPFKGIIFKVKGRINGADRSKTYKKVFGAVSFQSQNQQLDYGFSEAFTPSGKCSIHVWFNYKN